jgi:hypothetical protein
MSCPQVTTEKQIRKQLAEELGIDMEPYKPFVKKHVSGSQR